MSLFFCYLCLLIRLSFLVKGKYGSFYYVLEKDIDQIILVGDMFICYECLVMPSNNMSNDLNELIARKDKLEGELHHELSSDYNELMKNLSESFRDMHENSVQYYKQKANEELDKMEKNIRSGNKLGAINEKLLADTYLSFATTI